MESESGTTLQGEDSTAAKRQSDAPPAELVSDDTASSSSSDEDDGDEEPPMPLLSYSRLFGSLPRRQETTTTATLAVPSTCAVMGQINLAQLQDAAAASTTSGLEPNDLRTPERQQSSSGSYHHPHDPLLAQQPHYVLAMGYANGRVDLVDARTGVAIHSHLRLREQSGHEEAVAGLSMDATGAHLAAVDAGRMVVVWEFRYAIAVGGASRSPSSPVAHATTAEQQQAAPAADAGLFSGFMSALTLGGGSSHHSTSTSVPAPPSPPPVASPTDPVSTSSNIDFTNSRVPRLATSRVELSRITYPKSFGVPTCIAIDPTYSKKRDKAVLVGFLDGRLVLTKRGLIFQRRTDAIIYQGSYHQDKNHGGIEVIEWRGSFAAWADATGIRIFDTESLSRIAHIDRPTGARPSLYPTLTSLRPSLRFETSHYLLVAWGDCLMGLSITDHGRPDETQQQQQQQAPQQQQQPAVVRRRTVQCAMAWELDCVASGVVPLDEDHVIVLGLVPPCDEDEESENGLGGSGNDLELQIYAKEDGSIIFSNILPMLREGAPPSPRANNNTRVVAQAAESAADYTLLSTFAVPRMEDALEAERMEEEPVMDDAFDLQMSLFSPSNQPKRRFVDPHRKWNLNTTSFDGEAERNDAISASYQTVGDDDNNSVDSDDYGFIFRPLSMTNEEEEPSRKPLVPPPLMVIACNSDAVLANMRDIDDAVGHALASGKSALALQRGLRQRRQLRKFEKNDLANEYFASLLRIASEAADEEERQRNPLSIRRLKLAAKAMPVLFGGEVKLWERWITEAEKIPGALFVFSDQLPVRDPILPKHVYKRVLENMLKEIDEMKATQGTNDATTNEFIAKAEDLFLKVLTGWGPTTFLQEHIKHCKFDGRNKAVDDTVKDAEFRFARRFTQTAAGYLSFPVPREDINASNNPPRIRSEGYFDSKGSLFDIDELIQIVKPRAPLVAGMGETSADNSAEAKESNSRVALSALSRLYMMKGQYDSALKCFISLGALHVGRPLSDFKSGAVEFSESVGSRPVDKPWRSQSGVPYTFLLDIIDSHHLQQCILENNFLSNSTSTQVVPILSLLQLVGFTAMGNFLIEHCVPPQMNERTDTRDEERRGTLPLDLVAEQMTSSPRILHWYLHLVFNRKPEVYVRFPNTAYPPRAVTELHRTHFDLHLDFAGKERDSAKTLSGIEPYKVSTVETRLLRFLKTTLPLGGIRIEDAQKALEHERAKDDGEFSNSFALELAYIVENYGDDTESEADEVLDLYVKGANSLILAVSFAQRNRTYSSRMWKALIGYCLDEQSSEQDSKQQDQIDGTRFGALLEAAALFGADLAKLVTQIPEGMAIEGLRPRLVAAVADYRLKLTMHEAASEIAAKEMISILRELSHRSRRGVRYQLSTAPKPKTAAAAEQRGEERRGEETRTALVTLPKDLRTRERRDRHTLSIAPNIR